MDLRSIYAALSPNFVRYVMDLSIHGTLPLVSLATWGDGLDPAYELRIIKKLPSYPFLK